MVVVVGEVAAADSARRRVVLLVHAFFIVTVIAFFAILFTGRYPRSLFDFGVGVLRWSWRVGFYGYSALGTDKYPPFTFHSADHPADFDVDNPERLSRGLVLVSRGCWPFRITS